MTYLKDLLTDKEIEERWLIKNLIGMGEIAIMYAPPDHHKTGMALKIAMEVITGGQELGASLTGNVYYFSLDTPKVEMMFRAKALAMNSYPDHLDQIGSSLEFEFDSADLNLLHENFGYDPKADWYEDKNGNVTEYISQKISWYDRGDYDFNDSYKLVIIDTLSKAIVGSGINEDTGIRKAIHNLKQWIKGASGELSILLIHHTGKDKRKGMMGTSLLGNDISTVFSIKKKKDGFEIVREKHKSSLKGKGIPFKSRSVVIDHNEKKHESIYVDIGLGLDELSAEIVSQFNEGLTKKEIKGNTLLLGLGNTTTDKSFSTVFNRRWKILINKGFINEEETGNKHSD